ncbi:hypothetical protein VDGL01_05300 [Verticillium dahliae]
MRLQSLSPLNGFSLIFRRQLALVLAIESLDGGISALQLQIVPQVGAHERRIDCGPNVGQGSPSAKVLGSSLNKTSVAPFTASFHRSPAIVVASPGRNVMMNCPTLNAYISTILGVHA